MERNLKRLSLALLALGLSAPAFADNCVMVPSQQGGFKIGIDALYLRPNTSDLNYATVVTNTGTTPAFVNYERNITVDPNYDWGFYAQVGYLFPCTGNDLTLGYTYLRDNKTNHVEAGNFVTNVGPFIYLPTEPTGLAFHDVVGKSNLNVNVVDLEGGQRFTTGAYDMRMFAGLRYASIDHNLKTLANPFTTGVDVDTTTTVAQNFKSNFRGIGPRLGVDARYCLNSGFGVDANLSTALLVGTSDNHFRSRSSVTPGPVVTDLNVKGNSHDRVVPVLEAKLGVDYTHIIDCRCKSSIVFEAGYQVTNYFNAVDRPRVVDANTGGVVFNNATNDFSLDGPYFGVKYYA